MRKYCYTVLLFRNQYYNFAHLIDKPPPPLLLNCRQNFDVDFVNHYCSLLFKLFRISTVTYSVPGLDKAEHVWIEYRKLKTTIHEHASRNDDGKNFFRVKNCRYWLALSYCIHKKE